jgi:hypothetical protein
MHRFTWDPTKSALNLMRRGFDFAQATRIFRGTAVEHEEVRRDYGEQRVVAVGVVDDVCLTVVYTDRRSGDVTERRIISARISNRKERRSYGQRGALHRREPAEGPD